MVISPERGGGECGWLAAEAGGGGSSRLVRGPECDRAGLFQSAVLLVGEVDVERC
ncbi:hypothetical protein ACWGCW_23850 [Streptomyces sp. NPDC054933]